MKKLVLLVFLTTLLLSFSLSAKSYNAKAENRDDGVIFTKWQLQGTPTVSDVVRGSQTFSYINGLEGFPVSQEKGMPEIRFCRLTYLIQDREYDFSITNKKYVTIPLKNLLQPSRGEILRKQGDPKLIPYGYSDDGLKVRGDYEGKNLTFLETGFIRNVRLATLQFAIITLNHGNMVAKVLVGADITLTPRNEVAANVNLNRSRVIDQELMPMMGGMFVNLANEKELSTRWNYEVSDAIAHMLVFYTSRDASAIAPYITHKQGKGFTVKGIQVATGTNVVSQIKSEYTADKSVLYVQLVGDWADIKVDLYGTGYPQDTWAGEMTSDNYIDICVGRFSAGSATDVTTMVDKTIYYETHPNETWWKKGLGVGSAEGSGSGDDGEIDYDHIKNINNGRWVPKGMTFTNAFDPGASASTVTTAINAGCWIGNYCGHGSATSWGTTGYSNTNVASLTNANKYPFIFSVACNNGDYDGTTCFAEAWLRKANAGAVLFLGATISQPWVPPMIVQDYINDMLAGGYTYSGSQSGTNTDHGKVRIGPAVVNGCNLSYAQAGSGQASTIKTWIMHGDCSLRVVGTDGPVNIPPVANFTFTTSSLTANFVDASTDSDGTIAAWLWNFGNGVTSTLKAPPAITYSAAGTYTVTLTVTDNGQATGSTSKPVTVTSGVVTKEDAIASFSNYGLWARNSDTKVWAQLNSLTATMLATGDLDASGKADLVGVYGTNGIWIRYDSGAWAKVEGVGNPAALAIGDMNAGGKDDIVGCWTGIGVWVKYSETNTWAQLHNIDASMIACGNFDGVGGDDLLGNFPSTSGIWIRYATGSWVFVLSNASLIGLTAGDTTGDGRDEVVGNWTGIGVFTYNAVTGGWTKLHDTATTIAVGNLDGDTTKDLLGTWASTAGFWVRYTTSGTWENLHSVKPEVFTAGKIR